MIISPIFSTFEIVQPLRLRFIYLLIGFIPAIACNYNSTTGNSSKKTDRELYNTIRFQDSILFESFNSQNFEKFKSYFDDSLEIFQDNAGVRNYTEAMNSFKEIFSRKTGLNRKLVASSLEVYPIKNYGAIETGSHVFCHEEAGKQDCGTFKFVHIWKKEHNNWKITRIITYDH